MRGGSSSSQFDHRVCKKLLKCGSESVGEWYRVKWIPNMIKSVHFSLSSSATHSCGRELP